MKKIIIISILLSVCGNISAQQTDGYKPLAADTVAYYAGNFGDDRTPLPKKKYIGKPVADLLRDLEVPVGSFVLVPDYSNPNYASEFRFSNRDVNTTSTIIRNNNSSLYMLYVRFTPAIKYPTEGFMKENKEKALTPAQYAEFEQYTIVDIDVSTFPR